MKSFCKKLKLSDTELQFELSSSFLRLNLLKLFFVSFDFVVILPFYDIFICVNTLLLRSILFLNFESYQSRINWNNFVVSWNSDKKK